MYPPPYYGYSYPPPPPPEKEDKSSNFLSIIGAIVIILLLGFGGRYLVQYYINNIETKTITATTTDTVVVKKYEEEYPNKPKKDKGKDTSVTVKPIATAPISAPVVKTVAAPVVKPAPLPTPTIKWASVTNAVVTKRLNYKTVKVKSIYIYSTGVFTKGSNIQEYVAYLNKKDTKVMYHYLVNNNRILNVYPEKLQAAHGSVWANENAISIAISPNQMSANEMQTAIMNTAKLAADLCKKYKLKSSQIEKGENAGVLNNSAKWKAFIALVDIYLSK